MIRLLFIDIPAFKCSSVPFFASLLTFVPCNSTRIQGFPMHVLGSNRTNLAVMGINSLCLVAIFATSFPQKIWKANNIPSITMETTARIKSSLKYPSHDFYGIAADPLSDYMRPRHEKQIHYSKTIPFVARHSLYWAVLPRECRGPRHNTSPTTWDMVVCQQTLVPPFTL